MLAPVRELRGDSEVDPGGGPLVKAPPPVLSPWNRICLLCRDTFHLLASPPHFWRGLQQERGGAERVRRWESPGAKRTARRRSGSLRRLQRRAMVLLVDNYIRDKRTEMRDPSRIVGLFTPPAREVVPGRRLAVGRVDRAPELLCAPDFCREQHAWGGELWERTRTE